MFSIWFFLWLLLSAALLYFFGWILIILFRQKKTWKEYAKKKKLRYKSQQMFSSPEISGSLDGFTVAVFTGEHMSQDVRSSRKVTAIEVMLSSVMPFEGGIASGGMVDVLKQMNFKEEAKPGYESWDPAYMAKGDNMPALEAYLSEERVKALASLMKIKNSWVILVFRGDTTLLRFDTPEPLDKVDKIERIMKRMIEVARILELKSGEHKKLKSEVLARSKKEVSLNVDEEAIESAGSLQLEDEEAGTEAEQKPDAEERQKTEAAQKKSKPAKKKAASKSKKKP